MHKKMTGKTVWAKKPMKKSNVHVTDRLEFANIYQGVLFEDDNEDERRPIDANTDEDDAIYKMLNAIETDFSLPNSAL